MVKIKHIKRILYVYISLILFSFHFISFFIRLRIHLVIWKNINIHPEFEQLIR